MHFRYSSQNTEMRFGSFVFGPVILRLLHHFNQPDLAIEFMKDDSMSSIFGQVNSALLTMNLLYKNNRDKEVMDIFELVNSRETFLPKYPHDCVSQYVAAARRLVSFIFCFTSKFLFIFYHRIHLKLMSKQKHWW